MKYRLLMISLASLAILTSCSSGCCSSTEEKKSFTEYEIVSKQSITWEDVFKQQDRYAVFFYNEYCSYCHEMQSEIVDFAFINIIPTYFIDTTYSNVVIKKDKDPITGVSSLNDLYIKGTPTIIEINEGTVVSNVSGLDDCLTYLNTQRKNANNNL